MIATRRRDQKNARKEAEKLFGRLRDNRFFAEQKSVTEVQYPTRFSKGGCIIGLAIPVSRERLEKVVAVGDANKGLHHPPAIVTNRHGKCLRLIYRFRNIQPHQRARIADYARALGTWAEQTFNTRAAISPSPVKGVIGMRWRLRAL